MRLIVLPFAAALSISASPLPPEGPDQAAMPSPELCRDRITEVREAAGEPRLDRSPAVPSNGYMIAAVDKRVEGCAVMQMHRRIDDLRPLPEPSARPARLIPLGSR